jgi:hypothetical protein
VPQTRSQTFSPVCLLSLRNRYGLALYALHSTWGLAEFGFGGIPSCGWPGVAVYYTLVLALVLRKQGRKCAYLPCILDMAILTDKGQRIFGRQIDHTLDPG